jgi:predicted component of type VI protein secretion system
MKKSNPPRPAATDLDDEKPSLARARLEAHARRAKNARARDEKLIRKLMDELGVTEKELEARADADFDEAKAESAQWLDELRAKQKARRKGRGSLRTQIEAVYSRFGRTEVNK